MSTSPTTRTTGPDRIPVVVIGGGQAGLAMGYHLQRAGAQFVILDTHPRTGDSWRRRWASLRLFSPPRYASLPGLPIAVRDFPTRDEMGDYLEQYAAHFRLPIRHDTTVARVSRREDGFLVETSSGDLLADQVVVASGPYQKPRVPAFASALSADIRQLHSVEYADPTQLIGDVLVVGAANSGVEIALESAGAGHPTVIAGRHPGQIPFDIESPIGKLAVPLVMFVFRQVLTLRTPMGRAARARQHGHGVNLVRRKVADLDRAGVRRVSRIAGVQDGRPVTTEGEALSPRTVVWCTGFDHTVDWLDLPVLGPEGEIEHDRGVARQVPGLYFLGLEFQYAVASATIQGLDRDARYLLRQLQRRTRAEHGDQRPLVSPVSYA
jgi:putative flavoprotein involved in K+ transport